MTLHALHEAEGARFGERAGCELVVSYGDDAAAWRALKESVALQDRSGRGLLRLSGPERVSFLHGQTTNEVNGLAEGQGNAAALLTPRGKMLGEVRVLKRAEELLVETELGQGPQILAALERGCISEEVDFEDLSARYGELGLYGPRAAAVLGAASGGKAPSLALQQHRPLTLGGVEVVCIGSAGPGASGFDLLVPAEGLAPVWRALRDAGKAHGLTLLGEQAYELARVEAGLPRYGQDLSEETNPLEANLEADISYDKGCYVGQEVIAKATFRGHVSKKLARLQFTSSEVVLPGAELRLGDRVVGKVTSTAALPDGRRLGLGYLKRDLAAAGKVVEAAGAEVQVLGLAGPQPRD